MLRKANGESDIALTQRFLQTSSPGKITDNDARQAMKGRQVYNRSFVPVTHAQHQQLAGRVNRVEETSNAALALGRTNAQKITEHSARLDNHSQRLSLFGHLTRRQSAPPTVGNYPTRQEKGATKHAAKRRQ